MWLTTEWLLELCGRSSVPPKLKRSDLGIHLNISRLPVFGFGTLSVEDKEIRRRLFWSAYTWDKVSQNSVVLM